MDWDWSFAWSILPDLLWGVVVTIAVSLVASAFALAGGLALAVCSSISGRAGQVALRIVMELFRGVPILVLLYFGFYALPQLGITLSSFTVGVLVLGIVYAAFCSEVYRGALVTISEGTRDACIALGLSRSVTWRRILIPLAVRKCAPALLNYVLQLFRQSALLFAIGVPVLLSKAQVVGYERFRYLEPYTLAGVLYLLMNVPFIYLLHRYRLGGTERAA